MIITRYLSKEVLVLFSLITLILLLSLLCQQLVHYLNYVTMGKIPIDILLLFILFAIPHFLIALLPLTFALAMLLTYSRLYEDNEMIFLQLAGFGRWQLLKFSLFLSLLLSLVIGCLACWVNPWLMIKQAQLLSADNIITHLIHTIIPGRFQASLDGRYLIYLENLSHHHQRANHIFLVQTEQTNSTNPVKEQSMTVAKAAYQATDGSFVLQEGTRYSGAPGQRDYHIVKFKYYRLLVPPSPLTIFSTDLNDTAYFKTLWKHYDKPSAAAELQWRLSLTFTPILLTVLVVMLSHFRQSRYRLLVPVILAYVLYNNLLIIAKHWVENGYLSITFGLWWVPIVLLLMISLLQMTLARYHVYR